MKAGFRGWLYRWVSALFGLVGLIVFLSLAEVSRFYGFPSLDAYAWGGLGLAFLLFMSAFIGEWNWKRYFVVTLLTGVIASLIYLMLRPEMFRNDILEGLRTPPLSADLVIYRNGLLKGDPEREVKLERLGLVYSMLRTYGNRANSQTPTPKPTE